MAKIVGLRELKKEPCVVVFSDSPHNGAKFAVSVLVSKVAEDWSVLEGREENE